MAVGTASASSIARPGGSAQAEREILSDLYDMLEKDPSNISILEQMLELWVASGENDMASGVASQIMQIDPSHARAKSFMGSFVSSSSKPTPAASAKPPLIVSLYSTDDARPPEQILEEGYKSLMIKAGLLKVELTILRRQQSLSLKDDNAITNLHQIAQGRISTVIKTGSIVSVREVARDIKATPNKCLEFLVEDFEAVVQWGLVQNPPLSTDAIRERIVKRKVLMEAVLPASMEKDSNAAMAEIERRYLNRKYVNDETMLGDKIEEIPRGHFFVSEDNYAWDMEELANAIAANSGVMRNPLSRELFTERDIRSILAHPLGQRLRRMQNEQQKYKKGVRPETVAEVAKLGGKLLADQSQNSAPSHVAMDEFLAFVLTLPDSEQKTINSLKIPAADKNTKQPFDYTIAESVADGKSGMSCIHKVGDFLSQAGEYLRKL